LFGFCNVGLRRFRSGALTLCELLGLGALGLGKLLPFDEFRSRGTLGLRELLGSAALGLGQLL
jgi:hypothetical protein